MIHDNSFGNAYEFTSDFVKQCKQNEKNPKFILKNIYNTIERNCSRRQVVFTGCDNPELYYEEQGNKGSLY